MADTSWINWSALEAKLPEDDKIALEQALTQLAAPTDVEDTPYKDQTTETSQEVLERLTDSGDAKQENGKMFIKKNLIPDDFHKYIDE